MMAQARQQDAKTFGAPTAAFPLCAAQCGLLTEANHRVANQFAVLTSYIQLSVRQFQQGSGDLQDLQLALGAIEAKVRALASLHRLLTARPTPSGAIDLSLVLHEVCAAFLDQAGGGRRVVDAIVGPCLVGSETGLAAAQIVTEAILNGLKHAYPENPSGEIWVRSAFRDGGEIIIEVVDGGVGVSGSLESRIANGFGVRLMRGLAHQEDISLSFVPASPGLCVRLVMRPTPTAEVAPKDEAATLSRSGDARWGD